jgi:hypothetical protein
MAKKLKVREKQKIFTFFDCDKDLLMSPLPIAIKYLQEVQAAHPGVTVELYEEVVLGSQTPGRPGTNRKRENHATVRS